MPTTRSATQKQTKLDEFKPDNTSKPKPTAKKQQPKAEEDDDDNTTETKHPTRKKASKDDKPPKPTSPLSRGKAKVNRNRSAAKDSAATQPNTSAKRKAPSDADYITKDAPYPQKQQRTSPVTKNTGPKQSHFSGTDTNTLEKPIMINRSPVLQLWGATVAQFLHPDEEWSTCLSVGGSIAQLCAVSKGRAIGQISPKDESALAEDKRKKRKSETKEEAREIEVMGFPQQIQGDVVVIDGKPKPLKEGLLQGKFGGEEDYGRVKDAMEEALQSWKGDEDELDRKAFHMYERFRPDVAAGGSGWGRKGELNLQKVRSMIER
ncbi:hypothetical protein PMZ80_009353 [Knufia obscura]|uniref:Uncharacterized protein n=1 Tax=Knufia obscura TaxID=1635080 RepID=A0ABR0RCM5_9EURO|nr:hypothetical protein PMZ80_009353 [Knufia obscura]